MIIWNDIRIELGEVQETKTYGLGIFKTKFKTKKELIYENPDNPGEKITVVLENPSYWKGQENWRIKNCIHTDREGNNTMYHDPEFFKYMFNQHENFEEMAKNKIDFLEKVNDLQKINPLVQEELNILKEVKEEVWNLKRCQKSPIPVSIERNEGEIIYKSLLDGMEYSANEDCCKNSIVSKESKGAFLFEPEKASGWEKLVLEVENRCIVGTQEELTKYLFLVKKGLANEQVHTGLNLKYVDKESFERDYFTSKDGLPYKEALYERINELNERFKENDCIRNFAILEDYALKNKISDHEHFGEFFKAKEANNEYLNIQKSITEKFEEIRKRISLNKLNEARWQSGEFLQKSSKMKEKLDFVLYKLNKQEDPLKYLNKVEPIFKNEEAKFSCKFDPDQTSYKEIFYKEIDGEKQKVSEEEVKEYGIKPIDLHLSTYCMGEKEKFVGYGFEHNGCLYSATSPEVAALAKLGVEKGIVKPEEVAKICDDRCYTEKEKEGYDKNR